MLTTCEEFAGEIIHVMAPAITQTPPSVPLITNLKLADSPNLLLAVLSDDKRSDPTIYDIRFQRDDRHSRISNASQNRVVNADVQLSKWTEISFDSQAGLRLRARNRGERTFDVAASPPL